MIFNIEQKLLNKRKITSRDIWALVLEELKKLMKLHTSGILLFIIISQVQKII